MKQNLYAWLFEGGMIGVPKRLMGLMDPLGIRFDDLGKIMYLLYCAEDGIREDDLYAQEAIRALQNKGLIRWYSDLRRVDFSPMFDKIAENLGEQPIYRGDEKFTATEMNHGELVRKIERNMGKFLTMQEREEIEKAVQSYHWSYELIYEIYEFYCKNNRKHSYTFGFFCKMAFGAKVSDSRSFAEFVASLDTTGMKVKEVLRRLGKYNNPTAAQSEYYLKWANAWKFSHEMILLAADENLSADVPGFKYMDRVLEEWKNTGVQTPEDVRKREEMNRQARVQQKNRISQQTKRSYETAKRDLNSLIE